LDDELKQVIEGMNARLLKTEGELIAVAQVLHALVSIEVITTEAMKGHLEQFRLRITEQMPLDAATAIYLKAAKEMIENVLDENARPGFTIIPSGKE
jgi:hypothetical protein